MNRKTLVTQIREKASFLCVGLDTELNKIPGQFRSHADPVYSFNKAIIDATAPYAVAYKINLAFYEQYGIPGWQAMEKTLQAIPANCFTIADAKRGDIGNTGTMYARAFFEQYSYDAVTVSPYMGRDSIEPLLQYPDRFAIVLGLTSNPGSSDFQMLETNSGALYETVIRQVSLWGSADNLMFVVGATRAERLAEIRKIVPDHFLLVPGVGAQGGDLNSVAIHGLNAECGLLVNASRSILYASQGNDFAEAAATEARRIQIEMQDHLQRAGIL